MRPPEDFSTHDEDPVDETTVADPLVGVVFASRYRIDQRLGRGTTGAVYRASHVKFGRPFALKVLHAERTLDSTLVKRFEREAELGGKVRHPNVISVVDVGEAPDGTRWMVMELAIGVDLATLLQDDAPLTSSRVIHLLRGLCEGLHHAHERGVIHRDLKPENIIIERDDHGGEVPRIVDFGIAIARDEAEEPGAPQRLTTDGLVLGTPHYMAPEQATGSAMDHRIDLFALGVVAYEMLSGVLPFDGSGAAVARANLLQPTPPMARRAPDVAVDPLLEAFTQRLMAKDPDARPPSANAARELLDLIEHDRAAAAALLGLPIEAAEAPPASRNSKRLETVPDPVLLARRAAKPPPSWLTPTPPPGAMLVPMAPPVVKVSAAAGAKAPVELEPVDILLPPPRGAPAKAPATLPMPGPPVGAPAMGAAVAVQAATARPPVVSEERVPAGSGTGRRLAIAVIVLLLVVGGGVFIATRGAGTEVAVGAHDAAMVARVPTDAAVARVVADAPAAVVAPADAEAAIAVAADAAVVHRIDAAVVVGITPVHVDAGTQAAPHDAEVHGVKALDAAVAIVAPAIDAGEAAAPTASEIAALYTDVGGALRRLSDKKGPEVAEALWQRYRLVRLQTALASEPARREAQRTLDAIRKDATRAGQ